MMVYDEYKRSCFKLCNKDCHLGLGTLFFLWNDLETSKLSTPAPPERISLASTVSYDAVDPFMAKVPKWSDGDNFYRPICHPSI